MLAVAGSILTIFLASALCTGMAYWYARQRQWLAIPNARSSHAVPTPSSGGIGFVPLILFLLAVLGWSGRLDGSVAAALFGGGALVACVGWIDDRRQIPASIRALAYAIAAAWALWQIGGLDHMYLGMVVPLGMGGTFIALFGIFGFSNMYNFMDGIDGLVASYAVVAGSTLAFLFFRVGAIGFATVTAILAASAAGFLVWNWHPARIFMGDVGSVFLGFSFAVLGVAAEQFRILPALVSVILFAPFLVDGLATMFRRMLRGERWYEAHRTFAYQRAVQRGHRHSTVTMGALALEAVMVTLAVAGALQPHDMLALTFLAVFVSVIVWGWFQFDVRAMLRIRAKES